MDLIKPYAKFFVAALAAALTVLWPALDDGIVSGTEWLAVLGAGLGALGVWAMPNKPGPPQ